MSAVAVAVDAAPHLVLDEDYRIVEVGPAAQGIACFLGRDLWECFPASEPLFRPYYEQARRSGEPVEFVQFYDGSAARIRATPIESRLALSWEYLAKLETRTLDELRTSLTAALAALDAATSESNGKRFGLRLVVDETPD